MQTHDLSGRPWSGEGMTSRPLDCVFEWDCQQLAQAIVLFAQEDLILVWTAGGVGVEAAE